MSAIGFASSWRPVARSRTRSVNFSLPVVSSPQASSLRGAGARGAVKSHRGGSRVGGRYAHHVMPGARCAANPPVPPPPPLALVVGRDLEAGHHVEGVPLGLLVLIQQHLLCAHTRMNTHACSVISMARHQVGARQGPSGQREQRYEGAGLLREGSTKESVAMGKRAPTRLRGVHDVGLAGRRRRCPWG